MFPRPPEWEGLESDESHASTTANNTASETTVFESSRAYFIENVILKSPLTGRATLTAVAALTATRREIREPRPRRITSDLFFDGRRTAAPLRVGAQVHS